MAGPLEDAGAMLPRVCHPESEKAAEMGVEGCGNRGKTPARAQDSANNRRNMLESAAFHRDGRLQRAKSCMKQPEIDCHRTQRKVCPAPERPIGKQTPKVSAD